MIQSFTPAHCLGHIFKTEALTAIVTVESHQLQCLKDCKTDVEFFVTSAEKDVQYVMTGESNDPEKYTFMQKIRLAIVMELCQYGSLRSVIKEAAHLARSVPADVVARKRKPENLQQQKLMVRPLLPLLKA